MTFPAELIEHAERLLDAYRRSGRRLATAESCTGGLICALLTEIPGSSDVVERGFVTYSDAAKAELLAVPAALIASRGAVSAEVAEAMAVGALAASHADVAVSVTGIAGPGGATATKPVGLVHFGLARHDAVPQGRRVVLSGDRSAVRLASVAIALELLAAGAG